jgi:hypothetical protein
MKSAAYIVFYKVYHAQYRKWRNRNSQYVWSAFAACVTEKVRETWRAAVQKWIDKSRLMERKINIHRMERERETVLHPGSGGHGQTEARLTLNN